MKVFVCFLLLIAMAVPGLAQDDETLLPTEFRSGYFGGPVVKATTMSDEFALTVGARGGWVVNRSVVLGGSAHYLINSVTVETQVPDTVGSVDALIDTTFDIMVIYGGAEIEYVSESQKLLHYTAAMLVGAGLVEYKDYDCAVCEEDEDTDVDADIFFVVEPSVHAMLNVTPMLRIGLGASYRYAYDVEIRGVENEDLSGWSGVLTVKIGRF
jgi:hypothetical protein